MPCGMVRIHRRRAFLISGKISRAETLRLHAERSYRSCRSEGLLQPCSVRRR
nr:MAG TPA: hypothetical protein [Caudoviricetes sp.]